MFFAFFVWLGTIIGTPELAAIIAGVVIKSALPKDQIKLFESEINTAAYGLFAPLFFIDVGSEIDLSAFRRYALITVFIIVVTSATKVLLTVLNTSRYLGEKGAIVAGIALTVRLSTSIIVIKLLFTHGFIPVELFTVLVGTTMVFKFINPPLISYLITRWRLAGR